MLVSMKAILDDANENYYGVMAMNSINIEMVRAGIEAATEECSPIIIQMGPGQIAKHAHLDEMLPVVKELAEKAPVPVALNLDHGSKLEDEVRAIQAGFTNVMIDASALPYEENIQKTKTIVSLAHPMGVSVEAELGHVGQAADGDGRTDDMYTNVEQAKDFVERTGCDSLAIAIGTSHGAYKFKPGTKPQLRFDILEEVSERLPGFPIVLHGSSSVPQEYVQMINEFGGAMPGAIGVPEDQLRQAARLAVCKINIDSDLRLAMTGTIRKYLAEHPAEFDPRKYLGPARENIKQLVKHKIVDVLGCDGKA